MKGSIAVVCSLGLLLVAAAVVVPSSAQTAEPPAASRTVADLAGPFTLGGKRAAEPQEFHLQTHVVHYAPDGARTQQEVYRLHLSYVPAADGGRYVCRRFTVQKGDGPEVAIPSLADWSYVLRMDNHGMDEKGQLFGLDRAKFVGLKDEAGRPLDLDSAIAVINSFVDFHSISDVYAAHVEGGGIQDLHTIGQRIRHAASDSHAPLNYMFGNSGDSAFTHGEVTMELKGLSLVDGRLCAIAGYDSGDSSFTGAMEPMPGMKVGVKGSSHYHGNVYVDLASQWMRRADMVEMVVVQVKNDGKVVGNGALERMLTITSEPGK